MKKEEYLSVRVCVIILNWNGLLHTQRCLAALAEQTYSDREVFVIDNGSTDGSADALAAIQPSWWRLLRLSANRGFAGGMNAGIRIALASKMEYVWLLNNDAFPEPNCLARLVRLMDAELRVAMTTPRLIGSDGAEQHAGAYFHWENGENNTHLSANLPNPACDGTWLTGTAILVRTGALARVGLFDPHYFAYWEDVDLSVRLVRAGYDLRAVPEASCLHLGSFSSGGSGSPLSNYLMARNAFRFLRKHCPKRYLIGAWIHTINNWLTHAGVSVVKRRQAGAEGILRGLHAGMLGETGSPKRLHSPVPGERLILSHPWRLCRLLGAIGRRMEMSPSQT